MSDTASTGSTPIVVNDASAPSFEALESVLGETTVETPKAETKPAKASSETTIQVKPDASAEAATPKVEASADDAVEAEADPAAPAPVVTEDKKSFKLKTVSGREVDIPADAKIIKKIDGVDQEVSIQKALDEYSGKFVTEKRFTEIDNAKKAFEADIAQTEEKLSTILTKAHQKDILGAILEMSDIAGHDPSPIFDSIREQLVGDLDKFYAMSEQERELHFANKKIEFLTRSQKSAEDTAKSKQAQKELETKAGEMREALGVTDEWLEKAQSEYEAKSDYYKKTFLNGGEPDKTHFIQLADAMQRWDLAQKALEMVDPELAQDEDLITAAYNKLSGKKLSSLTVESASEIVGKPFKRKEALQTQATLTKKIAQVRKVSDEDNELDAAAQSAPSSKRKPKAAIDWDSDEL